MDEHDLPDFPYWKRPQLTEQTCPTRTLGSWAEFTSVVSDYDRAGIPFAFRGEANSGWTLTPTLLRVGAALTPASLLNAEKEAMSVFMAQAHLHLSLGELPPKGETEFEFEWWSLMQHFGAPTRLLDWTASAHVAAYFAVEQLPKTDGVITVVSTDAVQENLEDRFTRVGAGVEDVRPNLFNPEDPRAHLLFWDQPTRRSARSIAQQGLVSVAGQVWLDHSLLLNIATKGTVPETYKRLREQNLYPAERWVIPADQKNNFLHSLRSANIAAHSLSQVSMASVGQPQRPCGSVVRR
ncbi:MAG TPA: FRG domain-containing protein [Vicinamibacterales bacterium]